MSSEVEGFSEVAGIISLAKALHDIGRYDIVKDQFFDTLCYDSWFENVYGVISSIFSGFCNNYDDEDGSDMMVFTDDVFSDYFTYAWEHGVKANIPYDKNPYVKEAENEVRECLNCCYAMGSKLLGYTKTKKTARQSKLIVYLGACECDNHTKLVYGLIRLYEWFSNKVADFRKREGVMAA